MLTWIGFHSGCLWASPRRVTSAQRVNLVLRVTMESGIVLALAWWGFQATGNTVLDIVLGVGAPIVGFGVWGLLDFRWAGRWAEPLRLIEELAISGLAGLAWYAAGQHALAWSPGRTLDRLSRARVPQRREAPDRQDRRRPLTFTVRVEWNAAPATGTAPIRSGTRCAQPSGRTCRGACEPGTRTAPALAGDRDSIHRLHVVYPLAATRNLGQLSPDDP